MSGRNFNITDKIAVTGATNTGTGLNVFETKTQDNLQFRSITTGPNLSATINSGSIQLNNFPVIPDIGSLPVSPSMGDLIFFEPLRSTFEWTGTDWQGDVKYQPGFWKPGNTNASTYLNIGNSITGFVLGTPYGFFVPNFSANILTIRVFGFAVANTGSLTGDMELHNNATTDPPTFGTTGLGQALTLSAATQGSIIFSAPVIVPVGTYIQAFWRRTSGTGTGIQLGFLFANRIAPPP